MTARASVIPDSAVGPDAEARSKPFVAKPIDSASDRTSISDACALQNFINIAGEKGEDDFETAYLDVFATSGSPLTLAVARFNCGIRGSSQVGTIRDGYHQTHRGNASQYEIHPDKSGPLDQAAADQSADSVAER